MACTDPSGISLRDTMLVESDNILEPPVGIEWMLPDTELVDGDETVCSSDLTGVLTLLCTLSGIN